MAAFFDLRAAIRAAQALGGIVLQGQAGAVQYVQLPGTPAATLQVPSSLELVPNEHLLQLLGTFGEVKDVTYAGGAQRSVEFYDVRHAEAAAAVLCGSQTAQAALSGAAAGGLRSGSPQELQGRGLSRSPSAGLASAAFSSGSLLDRAASAGSGGGFGRPMADSPPVSSGGLAGEALQAPTVLQAALQALNTSAAPHSYGSLGGAAPALVLGSMHPSNSYNTFSSRGGGSQRCVLPRARLLA